MAGREHVLYWLTVDADRGQVDVYVNDMPAVRLGALGGRRLPINEYLKPGANSLVVRPGRDPNRQPHGGATLTITRADAVGEEVVNTTDILTLSFDGAALATAGPAGQSLGAFDSVVDGRLPSPETFAPIDASSRGRIIGQLERYANWWREGDAEALLAWLDDYVGDFTSVYENETRDAYAAGFRHMVERFHSQIQEVVFDPAALDLDVCYSGRLADCLRRGGGAAVTVRLANGFTHNARAIVGLRGDDVIVVR